MLGVRTRRHLLKLAGAGAAVIPILPLMPNSAKAGDDKGDNGPPYNDGADCKNDGTKCNCLLKGTHIATPMGEIPVEQLEPGNEICTLDGIRKIKWIGISIVRASTKIIEGWTPVRITRFALDDATPIRDLYLSPGHSLFADGVLIPVEYLINGTSISYQIQPQGEPVEYYHIECDHHEVLFAEGAPVESYRGENRAQFQNQAEHKSFFGKDEGVKDPYVRIMGYHGGFDELQGLLRSVVSRIVDIRDPIQIVGDRIDERAQRLLV